MGRERTFWDRDQERDKGKEKKEKKWDEIKKNEFNQKNEKKR